MVQQNGYFPGALGRKIYWQAWQCPRPRAVVLISHGLGEHGSRYRPLAERLVTAGYQVYAIDHRGHGHSYGDRGAIERFNYLVEDVTALAAQIRAAHPELPLVLFGHSMGGAVAVATVLAKDEAFAGLVLSGAALDADVVPQAVQRLGGLVSSVMPKLPTFRMAPKLVSRYAETITDFRLDPLNLSGKVPLRTISEIVSACKSLKARFHEISLPLLVLHGGADKLVPAASSERFFNAVGSDDKQLQVFPGLYHEILNESPSERGSVIESIMNWVQARY